MKVPLATAQTPALRARMGLAQGRALRVTPALAGGKPRRSPEPKRRALMQQLKHLGIIPDGNRRWARAQGKPEWYGHQVGIARFRDVIGWCRELKIAELTFYTLSVQNFKRDAEELNHLFTFIRAEIRQWRKGTDIRINPVGRLGMLPADIAEQCHQLAEQTKLNNTIKVNLAIGYGGREELLDTVQRLVGSKQPLTEENVSRSLWIPEDLDLVIRTSGEMRTSNFLIWQASYAEWFFSRKYWPEFDKAELLKAIESFNGRERRFGGK